MIAAEPLAQVGEVAGDGDDRHDLGGGGDVEAGLARVAVRAAAEARDRRSRSARSFMSMQRRQEIDERVDPERVAVQEVRVEQRREQVVRGPDRVDVAGEVEVQVLHRDDLRVAAAGRAALDPEHRAERGLAQAEHGLAAERAEPLRQRDRRRRLPLARLRRRDRRDADQLRVGPVGEPVDDREVDLRLVAAVRLDLLVGGARASSAMSRDRAERRLLGDLEAARASRVAIELASLRSSGSRRPRPARRRACRCGSARARTARSASGVLPRGDELGQRRRRRSAPP